MNTALCSHIIVTIYIFPFTLVATKKENAKANKNMVNLILLSYSGDTNSIQLVNCRNTLQDQNS